MIIAAALTAAAVLSAAFISCADLSDREGTSAAPVTETSKYLEAFSTDTGDGNDGSENISETMYSESDPSPADSPPVAESGSDEEPDTEFSGERLEELTEESPASGEALTEETQTDRTASDKPQPDDIQPDKTWPESTQVHKTQAVSTAVPPPAAKPKPTETGTRETSTTVHLPEQTTAAPPKETTAESKEVETVHDHVWFPITHEVWVTDKEEWTEDVYEERPVYETYILNVCNECGFSDRDSYAVTVHIISAHADTGGKGYSQVRMTGEQIGTEQVLAAQIVHPAQDLNIL